MNLISNHPDPAYFNVFYLGLAIHTHFNGYLTYSERSRI